MGSLQGDATKQTEKNCPASRSMLRFHWSMSSAGEKWRGAKAREAQSGIPNLDAYLEFRGVAEN